MYAYLRYRDIQPWRDAPEDEWQRLVWVNVGVG